tara:strand:- start:139 stop:534 length:396 start_codon:yes stop_codon:yes gene_type:complete
MKYIIFFFIGSTFVQADDELLNDEGSSSSISISGETNDSKTKAERVDKWFAIDKLQHFSYSCLISLGCQYVLVNKQNNTEEESLPISSALSFSAGLLKELNDNRGKNGFFSWKDMVANAAGIVVAAVIISN